MVFWEHGPSVNSGYTRAQKATIVTSVIKDLFFCDDI